MLIELFIPPTRPLFTHGFNPFLTIPSKIQPLLIFLSPYSSAGLLHINKTIAELPNSTPRLPAETCFPTAKTRNSSAFPEDCNIRHPALLQKLLLNYLSHRKINNAREVFDEIPKPNIFLYNAMIRAYAWEGPSHEAIDLYHHLIDSGIIPNKHTFPFVLKACSTLLALEEGIELHEHAKRLSFDRDVYISTALIDMYTKCGRVDDAHIVFSQVAEKDTVVWNSMIAGCSLHGFYDEAVGFLLEMQREGTAPNCSTMVGLLPVVGQANALRQGRSIHCFCLRRLFVVVGEGDVRASTAILDMYAKCGSMVSAFTLFNKMSRKNEVTWSAMIGGYVRCGMMAEALVIFHRLMHNASSSIGSTSVACVLRACAGLFDRKIGKGMHCYLIKSGFLQVMTVGNSLLSMYAKLGSISDAIDFFEEMGSKDGVSYSAIISGCAQNGYAGEALDLFRRMRLSRIDPDSATMVGVLPACAHMSASRHGSCTHGHALTRGLASDVSVSNTLIDMYAKCGKIELSRAVFDRMSLRDTVTWNAMIAGYGIHGLGVESVAIFGSMRAEGFEPDDITFVCLLNSCSHSGLIQEGRFCYDSMTRVYNIVPRMEHYICFTDLLARGGLLGEAREFIDSIPVEPDVRVWSALLAACRIHKNADLADEIVGIIQKLGPEGSGNFVTISNIFGAAGRYQESARVRIMQQEKGFKKSPGCSWVEVEGKIHGFIGGDSSHPMSSKIYEKLADLFVGMRKMGYIADTSLVIHDLLEEEKEGSLVYHSEKLAIAFALLGSEGGRPILVTKNLRVCGDCHESIKLISVVAGRAITVRDASRFHHFREGLCSCGDFW